MARVCRCCCWGDIGAKTNTRRNRGSAVARNPALKHVAGRYITFLDSDDILDPNYLENQLKFIKIMDQLFLLNIEDKKGIITTFIPRDGIIF